MPVRRPTTILAALTVVAATAVTGVNAGTAAASSTEVVQVTAVATAPCPTSKAEQRTIKAVAGAKAARAAAKRAQADARTADQRAVAAGSRKGGTQARAARKAAQAAQLTAARAAQVAHAAEVAARKAARASAKATRARSTPTCTAGPLTVSSVKGGTRLVASPFKTRKPSPSPSPSPSMPPVVEPVFPPGPAVPASAGPLDVSRPTVVVGTGTAGSCTETALRTAVAAGGVITFACGSGTTTIALSAPLVAPTERDTVIDGGHQIVLDGQDRTQILRAVRQDFRANDRSLAVQRLSMVRGRDVGTGFRARDGQRTCAWGYKDGGGGAISTRDLNVRVWGVTFEGNRGPELGPDVAGGAISMAGSKLLTVANSTFRNNSASNGGAIGALHVESRIYNTVFEDNRATGLLANFGGATGCPVFNHEEQGGAGGLGGAFYSDGFDPGDTFSGVRMSDNSSGDLGGAVFRSAYWGNLPSVARQDITWTATTLERNTSPVGGGGGAYLNNSRLTLRGVTFNGNDAGQGDGGGLKITGVTVDAADTTFTANRSVWGGGVAHWQGGPEGTGTALRTTFTSNTPQDFVGDWPR